MDWRDSLVADVQTLLKFEPPKKETIPVSVVISGHGYGHYLADCIQSVQNQNPGPKEIVYVDNGSDDNSIQIARDMGVSVAVVGPQERNICACRNRGALITQAPYIVFLDADDVIPAGYIKALYDRFTERRIGIVYPRHSSFGIYASKGHGDNSPVYAPGGIYRENYIAGQSMVRRKAYESVGGWGALPVFQDWEMWLRIIEQGWLTKRAGDMFYEHRTHANSLTASYVNRVPWYQEVLRRRPLTVFTPFGPGRPMLGRGYFDMLETLGLDWDKVTLFFYDNTNSRAAGDMLKGYLKDSPAQATIYHRDTTKVSYTGLHDRVMVMPERMAEMWTRATEMFTGAFVLSIEDDNIPYKPNGAYRLYEGLAPDVGAVCGPYHSRPIVDHNRLLALEWFKQRNGAMGLRAIKRFPGDLPQPPSDGCTEIGATGVGFVLIRKEILDGFEYPVGQPGSWCGQDFGLWRHVRDRGDRLMCHWGVPVKHYYTAEEYT